MLPAQASTSATAAAPDLSVIISSRPGNAVNQRNGTGRILVYAISGFKPFELQALGAASAKTAAWNFFV
jgi:hypothetical protein